MEFLHDMQEGEEEEEEEEDEEDLPPSLDPVGEDEGPELIPDAGDGSAEAAVPTWAASAAAMDAPATATTGLAAAGDGALAMVAVPADRRAGPSSRAPCAWRCDFVG